MKYSIYKITIGDKFYIGSSKNVEKRWRTHITNANILNNSLYQTMREYGIVNCIFEIMYDIECETQQDAFKYEQLELSKIHPSKSFNKRAAYATVDDTKSKHRLYKQSKIAKDAEYAYNNRPERIEYMKIYQEEHAEKLKAYYREYNKTRRKK